MLRLLEPLLLPPLNGVLLWVLGVLLRRRLPKTARVAMVSGPVLVLVQAMPLVGGLLLGTLQIHDPVRLDLAAAPVAGQADIGAIVVLSAEAEDAPEYGKTTVGRTTLQRIRFAAHLARHTELPILTSGGTVSYLNDRSQSLADAMRAVLVDEFGVEVRWVEARSKTTWENAAFSATILESAGIQRIYLVTNAWHLPRACAAFAAQGLQVVAAPTGFHGPAFQSWRSLLPSHGGMRATSLALHEWLGRAYYALRPDA